MSTGLACSIEEHSPGKWYYILENEMDPKGYSGSWKDNAFCYGPFASENAAQEHLGANHANPGGYSVWSFDPRCPNEDLDRLVLTAIPPKPKRGDGLSFSGPCPWG